MGNRAQKSGILDGFLTTSYAPPHQKVKKRRGQPNLCVNQIYKKEKCLSG
jgi:hypothetical protein